MKDEKFNESKIHYREKPKAEVVKSEIAKREEEILKFWQENKIFEKTLAKKTSKEFVFYDGPPFATGTPHYGHILGSAIKDIIPRYKTMRGFRVERRWGWDCHGLPIENIVEKDLKISGRKEIENYGVEKFNEYARSKVLTYVHEWKKTVDRMGRWVDFDGSYKTMDNSYIESVWWALKELNKEKYIYESVRVLPYCPRCETPIANSEIAMDNSYKDIKDISVYAKFQLTTNNSQPTTEEKTYFLAWTTTPWTLPGNFALAVNPEMTYIRFKIQNSRFTNEEFIIAKTRAESVLKDSKYEIFAEFKGKDLIGKSYKPLFDYFTKREFKNKNNAWKVYGADFVTTTDGTGIVHIAPGYGEDDMKLAEKEKIPFIHHVDYEGKFTNDVTDFAGKKVKPKDTKEEPELHIKTDLEIIRYLDQKGLLFAKESIRHSYPHCYRCETPLFYYAIPAWFVKISDVKSRLLKLNKKINWVPEHLRDGRFNNSMESAPDWNISRNRFWASPLPIWKCPKCGEIEFIGGVSELKKKTASKNKYFVLRHGEADNNVGNFISSNENDLTHLTEAGKKQVRKAAKVLKKEKIDLIISSPFLRTLETSAIVAETIGLKKEEIIFDKRIGELKTGVFSGKSINDYWNFFKNTEERFSKTPEGGENYTEIKKRMADFIYDIDFKYQNKKILIVSHETPIWLMISAVEGLDNKGAIKVRGEKDFIKNAEIIKLDFAKIPHNRNYELDLHRPFIDEIKFPCKCGGEMKRISEVIDCWFESGSMPFAANHFPFENQKWFKKHFPAQFVSEYIAQTRTWFYYMHALSVMLFKKIPFENVVTTGNVLAEDGQKMSKTKGNYADPHLVFDKYGADTLRYYLISSPLMRAEDVNFSEKGVDDVYKKLIMRLMNVYSFYSLYKDNLQPTTNNQQQESKNILDLWILARLNQLEGEITAGMESYELDKASRPLMDFVDDLSIWYLRRSRSRFKSGRRLNADFTPVPEQSSVRGTAQTNAEEKDAQFALQTTRFVLLELSKLMAPFMPFLAEDLYKKVGGEMESVHLESWPASCKLQATSLILDMKETRRIVSLGLEARAKAGLKVRQPLAELRFKIHDSRIKNNTEMLELIKDEVNVKTVIFDERITNEVELDLKITPELKEEGQVREFVRAVQELRKENKLSPHDKAALSVGTNEIGKKFIEKNRAEISKSTTLSEIKFAEVSSDNETKIDDFTFKFQIKL